MFSENSRIREEYKALTWFRPTTSYKEKPATFNPYINLPKYEETVLFYDFEDLQKVDPKYYYYSTKVNKQVILSKLTYRLNYDWCKREYENKLKRDIERITEVKQVKSGMQTSTSMPSFRQFTQKDYPFKTISFRKKLSTGGSIFKK